MIVDVADLRLRLRGALIRADNEDLVVVPADYIRDALTALPSVGPDVSHIPEELRSRQAVRDLIKRLRSWIPGSAFSKKLVNEGADALEAFNDYIR